MKSHLDQVEVPECCSVPIVIHLDQVQVPECCSVPRKTCFHPPAGLISRVRVVVSLTGDYEIQVLKRKVRLFHKNSYCNFWNSSASLVPTSFALVWVWNPTMRITLKFLAERDRDVLCQPCKKNEVIWMNESV